MDARRMNEDEEYDLLEDTFKDFDELEGLLEHVGNDPADPDAVGFLLPLRGHVGHLGLRSVGSLVRSSQVKYVVLHLCNCSHLLFTNLFRFIGSDYLCLILKCLLYLHLHAYESLFLRCHIPCWWLKLSSLQGPVYMYKYLYSTVHTISNCLTVFDWWCNISLSVYVLL